MPITSCHMFHAALPVLSGLTMAHAALAVCLDGIEAPFPVKMTMNSGATVEIVERTADQMRYRVTDPGRPGPYETLVQAGLFVIESTANGGTLSFDWGTDLPRMEDLVSGATLQATALMRSTGKSDTTFVTIARVTGEDVVTLDGCDYPVLVVEVGYLDGGLNSSLVTKYLHVPSQIILKNIVRQDDKVVENLVIKLE